MNWGSVPTEGAVNTGKQAAFRSASFLLCDLDKSESPGGFVTTSQDEDKD